MLRLFWQQLVELPDGSVVLEGEPPYALPRIVHFSITLDKAADMRIDIVEVA